MIIYGKRVVLYALEKHANLIEKIYLKDIKAIDRKYLKKFGDKIKIIEERWAQKLSRGGNHQGFLAQIKEPSPPTIEELKASSFVIFLDSITDVGNIGAIIRSAYALGADGVVVGGIKSINLEGIIRSSAGAALDMVPIVYKNLLELLNEFSQVGFIRYGANIEGEPLREMKFSSKKLLVLGSESRGLSKRVQEKIDKMVFIEMKRDFDSLNVSAAAAILIYRMANGN